MTNQQLFAEVFPIHADSLPPLTAYRLSVTSGESVRQLGTKLAAWLGEIFGGFWVYSSGRLITDAPPNPVKLVIALDSARTEQRRTFGHVESLEEDFHWQPSPDEIADYVVRGPLALVEPTILEALARTVYTIRSSRIEREYHLRTWVVGAAPALSVSVISRLLYEPDLQAYLDTLEKPSDIVGLWVTDKTSRVQGEVVKLVGLLDEQRDHLLELTQRETTRTLTEAAPGDHWVVRVLAGSREYDYVADALDLVIRPEDIAHFAINQQQIEKALHLKPALHAQMVKLVADVLKEANLIDNAYSTANAPELFHSEAPKPNLCFANNRVHPFNPAKLSADFKDCGAQHLPERLSREPLRVTVLNTLGDEVGLFLEALKRVLERDYKLALEVVRERNMRVISQANLESAIRLLQKEASDLVMVFLPDEADDEDEGISDRSARMQVIGRGLPCLTISASTLERPEAMTNVVMGLISRAGAAPYLLADPLRYADHVVGLSLIHQTKREGDLVTGVARIYANDGTLLRGVLASAPLAAPSDGGIPEALLEKLLPRDLLREKRIIIHANGRLRRDTLRALGSWEDALDAALYPVEVIRSGVPRMYALSGGKIEPPSWGSVLKLSRSEAFVQSSDTTVQPLHVRCEQPLTIEEATHSVLLFTLLNYGAVKPTKLPATVHNADPIENGIVRGVMPAEIETNLAFWL